MSTPNPTRIIPADVVSDALAEEFNRVNSQDCPDPSELAAHVVSKLKDAGCSIVPSDDVEKLRSIRWTVDGSAPMDLKDEYADGFNAAMRNIHRILHPAAAAEGEKP